MMEGEKIEELEKNVGVGVWDRLRMCFVDMYRKVTQNGHYSEVHFIHISTRSKWICLFFFSLVVSQNCLVVSFRVGV